MIVIEHIQSGDRIGQIVLEGGELLTDSPRAMELIEGRRALGMSDRAIYDWLAAGGYDNGYQRGYRVR